MNLWQELRRRRVFRTAGLYIVGAWLIIQVADISFPAWGLPETGLRYLFIAAAACFPVVLVFGWFFDVTAGGIVRTQPAGDAPDLRLRRADYVLLLAFLGIGATVLIGTLGGLEEELGSPTGVVASGKPAHSVAVLPFRNLDPNAETGFFSDGITEEVLHRLSSIGALHVLASNSSFPFRDSVEGPKSISDKLGVRYLLQGSVRRDADFVRVTARLVDETGFQVWSEIFDRELESIFVIQTEIASRVASHVVDEIVPPQELPAGRTTENMAAYTEYLRGRAFLDARVAGWQAQAAAAFRRAIELDPGYAPPYAGLATATTVNTDFGPHWDEGETLARKSLELDPELANAHAILGLIQSVLGRPELGVDSLNRAIELDPSLAIAYSWQSFSLFRLGREGEARDVVRRGLEIDPLNPIMIRNESFYLSDVGRFDRAEQLLLRLTNLPEPPGNTWFWLSDFYANWGRFADAFEAAAENLRRDAAKRTERPFATLALASARLGLFEDSDRWAEAAENATDDDLPQVDLWSELSRVRGDSPRQAATRLALQPPAADAPVADRVFVLGYGGLDLINTGDVERGLDWLEQALMLQQREVRPEGTPTRVELRALTWRDDLIITVGQRLVYGYRYVGREADAGTLLEDLLALYGNEGAIVFAHPRGLADRALTHALAGQGEVALATLREAVELGWAGYYQAVNDPVWGEAFEQPGFEALLETMKANVERQRAVVESGQADSE